MNIQIFIGKKNFDCQKAERWFKERRIPYQLVDLSKKGLSPKEFDSVAAAVGFVNIIDTTSKAYAESPARFMSDRNMIKAQLLEHQNLLKTPIVRNGKEATVGFCPEVWENWK